MKKDKIIRLDADLEYVELTPEEQAMWDEMMNDPDTYLHVYGHRLDELTPGQIRDIMRVFKDIEEREKEQMKRKH